MWSARCVERRTAGAAGGPGKPTGSNPGRAPRSDPTCLADDQLWGITRLRKGGDHTLAALKSIRAARPDGAPIYMIVEYVPRNIFLVLCPAALCDRRLWSCGE